MAGGPARTAREKALDLLAVRDRSRRELERALHRRGFGAEEVADALAWLARLGYVDDERFAASWIRSRLAREPVGGQRLVSELLQRGVERSLAQQAVRAALGEGDEAAACLQAARRAAGRYRHLPLPVRRRRLAAFLTRRGFAEPLVRRAVAEVAAGAEETLPDEAAPADDDAGSGPVPTDAPQP